MRRRQRTLSDLPTALAFCLVSLMTICACKLVEPGIPVADTLATGTSVKNCIATPDEWVIHWVNREADCVVPSLFATVIFPADSTPLENNYVYPCNDEMNPCGKGFRYAWAFSNTNLELALELNQRYHNDPTRVASALFSLVGFTGVETFDSTTQVYLVVYELPAGERPLVPTWETWFRLLDELAARTDSLQELYSDQDIQARLLRAQQSLVHQYSRIGSSHPEQRHQDVVAVYSKLSGCPRTTMISAPNEDGTGTYTGYLTQSVAPPDLAQVCDKPTDVCWDKFDSSCTGHRYPAYKKFMVEADLKSPYAGADSQQCFIKALAYLQDNRDMILDTTLRAMIAQCQDANMLNTGTGLGYNTYPNPTSYLDQCGAYWDPVPRSGDQTVPERLTGREFIVINRKLKDLPSHKQVRLFFGETGYPRPYLVDGYCE